MPLQLTIHYELKKNKKLREVRDIRKVKGYMPTHVRILVVNRLNKRGHHRSPLSHAKLLDVVALRIALRSRAVSWRGAGWCDGGLN
ncbi:unnamed protein product [Cercopithifilaria johnstoni]|uniref:Uncharacterized protein n=1 Tax=Cercopithifilaria johnstoni TaxID=2874296 RepID=A0A8J2M4T8_9BILA|nr:unnamed protein product [Cercopithifilaria johnstoni]